ncbi:MAG: adenylate/guanylate cyclase domain-containing protein [SAR324 cluster bacterium]|nr:adenylate/guanylate cyclase domain-containing protein [SAR324 cluster bacterium]
MRVLDSIHGLKSNKVNAFFNELFLNSGQYAVFYLILEFSDETFINFLTAGHVTLLVALILQTLLLAQYGHSIFPRFFISLVAPLIYTLSEIFLKNRAPADFLLQSNHLFFWIYSISVGGLQCFALYLTEEHFLVKWLDVLSVFLNVSIFGFLYFSFDTIHVFEELFKSGKVSAEAVHQARFVMSIPDNIPAFFDDTTHLYIILGGFFLAIATAYSRFHLLKLKGNLQSLSNNLVGETVVKTLMENPALLKGHSRTVSILFSDIRSFTSLSERLTTEEVFTLLNRYFSVWERVVERHGGVIDKFIGDAVMVVFGAPTELGNHAQKAVDCAHDMISSLKILNQQLAAEGMTPIKIGIGIHTGEVLAGSVGGEDRFEYTVIGDTVNVASRIESLTKQYATVLLISGTTYRKLAHPEPFFFLRPVKLKGKNEEVAIFGDLSTKKRLGVYLMKKEEEKTSRKK